MMRHSLCFAFLVLICSTSAWSQTPPPSSRGDVPKGKPLRALPKSDCSPSPLQLRTLASKLRPANPDNNDFIRALDKAVLPFGINVVPTAGTLNIYETSDISITAVAPYILYRFNLMEALRKFEPITTADAPLGVAVNVSPKRINAPNVIKIVLERDGKLISPIGSLLRPQEMTTGMGVKTSIHAGVVVFSCAAFAPGAAIKVTAVSENFGNMVKTFTSDELAGFR